MTPEIAVQAGRAIVYYLREQKGVDVPEIVIGRDTRISGPMLASAIMSGICSMGGNAMDVGIMPTPGVAHLTRSAGAHAGVVISASHNPFQDNGIKLFKGDGYKLSDTEEADVEDLILGDGIQHSAEKINDIGRIQAYDNGAEEYLRFLQQTFQPSAECNMIRLVVDCSNGATSAIALELFQSLGFATKAIFHQPDGKNINAKCGSQHPEKMAEVVVHEGADIGLAFDGDGDRLIAVDEKGRVLTGDQIICICALFLKKNGQLNNNTVISTVMSNMGLGVALQREGIQHVMSDVGDRYVMEQMIVNHAVLGGEDSGHIIFLDHHTTGDGMLAALQLLQVILDAGKPLSEMAEVMTVFPQKLMNVDVASKTDLSSIPEIQAVIDSIQNELSGKGRVLVRYSGTQPMCRVMVEAPTEGEAQRYAGKISRVIAEKLGGGQKSV